MHPHTLMVQAGSRQDPATGAISTPLHFSAAFQHPALGQSTGFDYSRTANPTRQILERTLAALDAVLRLFAPGDTMVVTEDLYGGSFRLFERFYRERGLSFLYVDTSDTAATAQALDSPGVAGLFVELPTNPLLKTADLAALSALARTRGILFLVDNTFLTPALCRPLDHGADVTLYSATKYLGGHHDCLAGLAVTRDAEQGERLAFIQNATGAVLGPFESWLLLRSLKTLPLRMARHGENALRVASFLESHPGIRNLRYPGLPSDPGHRVLAGQASGFGGMISCEVASRAEVERILASVRVFLFAESLGGAESLITFPLVQTHADIDPRTLERLGVTDRLLRLSIGLEDPEDLIADLRAVLG
jgi:cystathionine beta-lyase/cystathionine gamma-synthase